MAKKQTRRTISFNRHLYELIHAAAARAGISAAQWITEAARDRLVKSGVDAPSTSHMKLADVHAAMLGNPTMKHRVGGGRERVARLVANLKREWGLT